MNICIILLFIILLLLCFAVADKDALNSHAQDYIWTHALISLE